MKNVFLGLLAIGGSALLFAGFMFFALFATNYFQPKYEAIRNKTFHESQSYNDGMLRDFLLSTNDLVR